MPGTAAPADHLREERAAAHHLLRRKQATALGRVAPVIPLPRGGNRPGILAMTAQQIAEQLPTSQATPNSPKVSATRDLVEIVDFPCTQQPPTLPPKLAAAAGRHSLTDFFAGAGGSSLGAVWSGITDIVAANHWPAAGILHAQLPGRVVIADVADAAARFDTPTTLLWNSPPCPPYSQARRAGKVSQSDRRTPAERSAALKAARGSMWAALDFVEAHRDSVEVAVTENVVELVGITGRGWQGLGAWLAAWEAYGYRTEAVYLNSMFAGPIANRAPQSRDRVYFIHIRDDVDSPNLDIRPEAPCRGCRRDVRAKQRFKAGRTCGKYRTQYIYACPRCGEEVTPPARGLDGAIDFDDPGTPIRDRALGTTTLARIQAGLDRLVEAGEALQPLIVAQDRSNEPNIKPARPVSLPGQTLTGRQVLGLVSHPDLVPPGQGERRRPRRTPRAEECSFRMLNSRELARIAGFPDSFVLVGSKRDVALAMGNAVTPQAAQELLTRVVLAA